MTEPTAAASAASGRAGRVIGIGVDAVDVDRYRAVLARTPRLTERTFTSGELEYARRQLDPTQRLAARFAAKEATMKALGVGLGACKLRDIEVVHEDDGRPRLALHAAAHDLATARGAKRFLVTMTHTDHVAIAYVAALDR